MIVLRYTKENYKLRRKNISLQSRKHETVKIETKLKQSEAVVKYEEKVTNLFDKISKERCLYIF